jgi:hypothetical protein
LQVGWNIEYIVAWRGPFHELQDKWDQSHGWVSAVVCT